MTGAELRKLRERKGLNRVELAELVTDALGPNQQGNPYSAEAVRRWETGRAPSTKVATFLDELAVADGIAGLASPSGLEGDDLPLGDAPGDSAPGGGVPGGGLPPAAPKLGGGSSAWSKACEELWELIATGVGLVGAGIGNEALVYDAQIIAADKEALGQAWGRLAETNETFRRMLVGMTEGGVWLQVALVTSTTFSKCWQNHQAYAAHLLTVANGDHGTVTDDGIAAAA